MFFAIVTLVNYGHSLLEAEKVKVNYLHVRDEAATVLAQEIFLKLRKQQRLELRSMLKRPRAMPQNQKGMLIMQRLKLRKH